MRMSRLDPPWLKEPELQQIFSAANAAGGEVRAVGGCVRDLMLGVEGSDVDLATTLPAERMMEQMQKEGFKVKPTGLAHGTITVILSARAVEITTLRRDVETDGRHATIAYTDRFEEDAARRDFTINALYMDAAGNIYDYFSGQQDIKDKKLRFIGDANARVEEDGLRILRYFLFLATLGWEVDAVAMRACEAQRAMLNDLSGERIQQEMKKLLAAADPRAALAHMQAIGLHTPLTACAWDLAPLVLSAGKKQMPWNSWRARLYLLAPTAGSFVAERWKLSRKDAEWFAHTAQTPMLSDARTVREALRHHPRAMIEEWLSIAAATGTISLAAYETLVALSLPPSFPVTAKDLLARGMKEGPALGRTLKALEARWRESDYTLSADALLKSL